MGCDPDSIALRYSDNALTRTLLLSCILYISMNTSDNWIKDDILQLFHSIADDFKNASIDEQAFRERILRLAERYERTFVKKELSVNQKELF
ncbi:MAG: hypothetical protein EPN94_01185 [Nitrospirae bacterium]|nr:MAG: hypothetical protein EPN94_01185 [Nitrospirota bacterium]